MASNVVAAEGVEEWWLAFSRVFLPPSASLEKFTAMRLAFYAGAGCALEKSLSLPRGGRLKPGDAAQILEQWRRECQRFWACAAAELERGEG